MPLEREGRKSEFARRLLEAGYKDFLILEKDDAQKVLTQKRRELLGAIEDKEIESITHLSEAVGRDVSIVHRDLDLLFKYDIIEYDEKQGRKIPKLKHEHVFVEPLF
ncbi:MAG: hypothetical protein SV377_02360 [Halobacteria archaeon]|nr:hypothetical protein [Halobacteria archaeon]